MKKRKIILSLVLILIALVTAELILDKQLYFYGRNNFDLYNDIPLNIKPVFRHDFEGGIYLGDEIGMSILVKGLNSYRNGDSIYVKTIKRYGYSKNSKKVVAEVEDIKGRSIYIDFSGKEPEALFQINILKDKFAPKGYNWIDLTNGNLTEIYTF